MSDISSSFLLSGRAGFVRPGRGNPAPTEDREAYSILAVPVSERGSAIVRAFLKLSGIHSRKAEVYLPWRKEPLRRLLTLRIVGTFRHCHFLLRHFPLLGDSC